MSFFINYEAVSRIKKKTNNLEILASSTELYIEDFTVAEDILVVGQTRQNLQWMYGKNRDFDTR